jgi:hypothetical protein
MSDAIDLPTAVAQLRQVSAVVVRALDELEREWAPDPVLSTVLFGEAAHALSVDLVHQELLGTLNVIEDVLRNGLPEVRDAVATGFLEALLAESSAGRLDLRPFIPSLGPEAIAFCRAWDQFTGVQTPGL